jgi:hypothetical protein
VTTSAPDGHGLTGGHWVHRHGVRVWVPTPTTELTPGPCINCRQMAIGLRCRTCRDHMQRPLREAA